MAGRYREMADAIAAHEPSPRKRRIDENQDLPLSA